MLTDQQFTVAEHGFTLARAVVSKDAVRQLADAMPTADGPGLRRMLTAPCVAEFANSAAIRNLLRPHFANEPFPVRAILFNKSADSNWFVSWHQDLTIAVARREEVDGFGPWSVKDDVPHVQPPTSLLERMLAVRLHLDDADESNGALRVIPSSHQSGRLTPTQIEQARECCGDIICTAETGDVLLMRPLILHASSRSTDDRPRRVLHIEYAEFALPGGLAWHAAA